MSSRDPLRGWFRCCRCSSEYRYELIKSGHATDTHCPMCLAGGMP